MTDVLDGKRFKAVRGDVLDVLPGLPDGCVDLVFFSPPYSKCRLYLEDAWHGGVPDCRHEITPGPVTEKYSVCRCGAMRRPTDLGIARDAEQWVAWMVEVFRQCRRVCTGLVACVCDDQTEGYRYGCSPYLLMADLVRAGFNLRRPCIYRRSGIPGSGGPDWFRCDHEPIICVTPPGRLPWSDVTACGHPPKWAPGGEMSHRMADGTRTNDQWGSFGDKDKPKGGRRANGKMRSTEAATPHVAKRHTKARRSPTAGDVMEDQSYTPPVLANPGTVVQQTYTAEEVADLLGEPGDVVDCVVGGGQMGDGDKLARLNEAPFPESLPERFIRSFCPPGGIVLDPFSGSGTTVSVAVRWNRRGFGIDLRQSQVDLTLRRLETETPLTLFAES